MWRNAFEILDLIMANLGEQKEIEFAAVYETCKRHENEGVTNQVVTMLQNRGIKVNTCTD